MLPVILGAMLVSTPSKTIGVALPTPVISIVPVPGNLGDAVVESARR